MQLSSLCFSFSPCTDPGTPGASLVGCLEILEPPTPGLKSGDAEADDWPQPRNGSDPYGCASACSSPVRLTLPPLPPLSVPLSPAAAWVSGVLSPLRIFSPMLAPLFGGPAGPPSASGTESAQRRRFTEDSGFAHAFDSKIGGESGRDSSGRFSATVDPTLTVISSEDSEETGLESCRSSLVKLSMPPKSIERRTVAPTELFYHSSDDEGSQQGTQESAALPLKQKPAASGHMTKPIRFQACNPGAKVTKVAPRRRPARVKKRATSASEVPNAERDRLRYQHVWGDQRDAVAEQLSDIGFEILQFDTGVYKCSLCPQTFTSRMYTVRHAVRMHLHGKVFVCKQCNTKFTRSDTLVRHMKRTHCLE